MIKENRKTNAEHEFAEPVYTIGVAAGRVGISDHSLRQYENEGLIIPYKTPTGRRLYSDLELEKVRCIKDMIQEQGLNFAGIRRLMALIPCWKLKKCPESDRGACLAFKSRTGPCWASKEKCGHPLPSCRDCEVYRSFVHCDDILPLIYEGQS